MRDALFIIFVIFLLLALSAVRYRKQVVAMIRIHRMLKNGQMQAGPGERQIPKDGSTQLVNCAKCGVWVPLDSAIVFPNKMNYCSTECLATSKT